MNFGPASATETVVFGASRPGYGEYHGERIPLGVVREWIAYMRERSIARVCCLLSRSELARYECDLLRTYREAFGEENVAHVPTRDFYFADARTLRHKLLPFLAESEQRQMPVVVHCSAGMGRTSRALAAWLVAGRGYTPQEALRLVREASGARRNPSDGGHREEALIACLQELVG